MKLKQSQIESFLKEPIHNFNIIMIYGNAKDQIRQAKKNLVRNLGGKNLIEEMRLLTLTEKEVLQDTETLFLELKTKSFFKGSKIIIVENITDASKIYVKSLLEQKLPSDETFLILIGDSLSSKSSIKKLVEEQVGTAVGLPIYAKVNTIREIKNMLEVRGLQVADESCVTLIKEISEQAAETNLLETLDKLELAFLNEALPITCENIESISVESIPQNYFFIVETVAQGDLNRSLNEFRKYAIGRENFSGFISFLSRYFRNIYTVKANINTNIPYFGKTREKFDYHVKIWTIQKIEKVMNLIFDLNIELREKSFISNNVKIERSLMNICSFIN